MHESARKTIYTQQGDGGLVSRRTVIVGGTVALWTLNELKLTIVRLQSSGRPDKCPALSSGGLMEELSYQVSPRFVFGCLPTGSHS